MPRRDFMQRSVAAAAFTIVPRHVLGKGYRAPSDMLNVACIGVGGMGRSDVRGFSTEHIRALCDVDQVAAEDAYRAHPDARRYTDFREMLAREGNEIDLVTVSTPDHTHAVAAMAALKMNKPVYCQKPLARTLGEVRALRAEARRRPRVPTIMGNQGHAGEG
ncbi:MAG: Gfo/Idh/MocA family oxidoreductase, partial [Gemmatimonadales bacterium]